MPTPITAITDVLESSHLKFYEAWKAGDVETIQSLMAEKVVQMPPNEPTLSGWNAVKKWLDDYFTHFKMAEMKDLQREVIVIENWAVESVTVQFKLLLTGGGSPIRDEGRSVFLWKRDRAGSWKIHRWIWNSSKPFGASMGRMMAKLAQPKLGN
jgi:ketosteroid isomerase-like protein